MDGPLLRHRIDQRLFGPRGPCSNGDGIHAPSPTSAPTMGPMNKDQLEMAAQFEECRRKLQDERTSGLITSLRLGASAVEIDVDKAKWKPLPFDSQLAIVKTVSCYAVAGNPKLHARVEVLDNLDHQALGTFDGSVLKAPLT